MEAGKSASSWTLEVAANAAETRNVPRFSAKSSTKIANARNVNRECPHLTAFLALTTALKVRILLAP
jgi:hypothetical protein